MRTNSSVLLFLVALGAACRRESATDFPTIDHMTAGIFLDDAERVILPAGVELRSVSERGIALTKTSEGFRSRLYNDAAGYCTIGYGHLLKRAKCDGTEPPHFLRGVTEPEGTELLVDDMAGAQVTVMTSVEAELTDSQYAALCDFVFNVGSRNFRDSTLLRVVNAGDFPSVPLQLRRWVYAGGREFPGLKTRRENEIELFFDGLAMPREAPPADLDLSPIDIRNGEPGS